MQIFLHQYGIIIYRQSCPAVAEASRFVEIGFAELGFPKRGRAVTEHHKVGAVDLVEYDVAVVLAVEAQECVETEAVHGQGVGNDAVAGLSVCVFTVVCEDSKYLGYVHSVKCTCKQCKGVDKHAVAVKIAAGAHQLGVLVPEFRRSCFKKLFTDGVKLVCAVVFADPSPRGA